MALRTFARLDGTGWSPTHLGGQLVLRCDPPQYVPKLVDEAGKTQREWKDPLSALRWLEDDARSHPWIGFLSYDLGRFFEELPSRAIDDLKLPLFAFLTGERLMGAHHIIAAPRDAPPAALSANFTRQSYEQAVERVLEYIRAGDAFQVNLAQRFTIRTSQLVSACYERLKSLTPAVYSALLDFGDFQLLSNSPELFLRVEPGGRIITRPIKGTRPLLPGMEAALRDSPKDQAELNMIIDLERNDLGRVCRAGSVRVTQPRIIEAHPTVYHGVATIEGQLRSDVKFVDLLAATFPGGSVTGAPKIRAMQIIEELEPCRRGPYCGAIGMLSPDGTIELNLAIRTIVAAGGAMHVSVGGGIVADSRPADEFDETLVKARAMFAALGIESIATSTATTTP